jgi:hypothetical protein
MHRGSFALDVEGQMQGDTNGDVGAGTAKTRINTQ